ncbi:hypothetical protein TNCV_5651 [Trichonephila clavipes]|nr:hypothetical protein TNCV_5651 [Trichonephila clavipes]
MSSLGFEPRSYGRAVSVANHYTGWVTYQVNKVLKSLQFGASETGHTIVGSYYCERDRFRCSQLSPYIYNGELSSKAVKPLQWTERACESEHVSDTCRFLKKPGERTIGELCTNGALMS